MDAHTPHPMWGTTDVPTTFTGDVTRIVPGARDEGADLAFLIGGVIGGVLLLLLCVMAVLLWCLSRQKGSYVTNELDEDEEEEEEEIEEGGDDESVSSATALRGKEALQLKEEE